MSELIKSETVKKIAEIPNLPPLPVLGQRILAEVNNDEVDIDQLSLLIEQDPALFARIIGIANSAYFGCPEPIYTISKAIVQVLGLSLVKSLACSIILSHQFRVSECRHFDLSRYWYKAMMTAMLAKFLQHGLGLRNGYCEDQAYLGGLLHNLGELVLVHAYPEQMDRIYSDPEVENSAILTSLQDDAVGLTFMEAGSILASKWHLPPDIRNVLQNYDSPAYRGEDWKLVNLIGLAAHLGKPGKLDQDDLPQEAWRKALDVSPELLTRAKVFLEEKSAEVQSLADVLSME